MDRKDDRVQIQFTLNRTITLMIVYALRHNMKSLIESIDREWGITEEAKKEIEYTVKEIFKQTYKKDIGKN